MLRQLRELPISVKRDTDITVLSGVIWSHLSRLKIRTCLDNVGPTFKVIARKKENRFYPSLEAVCVSRPSSINESSVGSHFTESVFSMGTELIDSLPLSLINHIFTIGLAELQNKLAVKYLQSLLTAVNPEGSGWSFPKSELALEETATAEATTFAETFSDQLNVSQRKTLMSSAREYLIKVTPLLVRNEFTQSTLHSQIDSKMFAIVKLQMCNVKVYQVSSDE